MIPVNILGHTNALKCYSCSSKNQTNCNDPFNLDQITQLTCSNTVSLNQTACYVRFILSRIFFSNYSTILQILKSYFWMKKKQKLVIQSGSPNSKSITRDCLTSGNPSSFTCSTDLCNDSGRILSKFSALMSSLVLFLISLKTYF